MDPFLEIILRNAAGATVLAGVTLLVSMRRPHPAIVHAMWVLVLAKLLVPAAFLWGWMPAAEAPERPGMLAGAAPEASAPAAIGTMEAGGRVPASVAPTLSPLAAAVGAARDVPWVPLVALGAAGLLGLTGLRAVRFRALVSAAGQPSPEAEERAARIGARLGLRRRPAVRLVDAALPPSLWAAPRAEILIPSALWEHLEAAERDALIAHELAHYRRRDHWIRFLELAAVAAFWWFPLVWWTRGRLRAAEEAACDSLALSALGARAGTAPDARPYASALLKTLEFLSARPSGAVPALATGAGDFSRLKERMVMIVRNQPPRAPSRALRRLLAVGALLALLAGPTWSTQAAVSETPPPPDAPPAPEAPPISPAAAPAAPEAPEDPILAVLPEIVELQEQEMALRLRMEELRVQREQLDLRMQDAQLRQEALEVAREIQRLEGEGRSEEAAILQERAELFRQELEVRRQQLEAEHAHRKAVITQELRMQKLELKQRAAEAEMEQRRALELEREARRAREGD